MTRMLGVPANLVISAAFAISGLLAGIVAIFWVGRTASVTPTIGAAPLLVAFVATVIGGMRSLTGAVVGGFVYGIIYQPAGRAPAAGTAGVPRGLHVRHRDPDPALPAGGPDPQQVLAEERVG